MRSSSGARPLVAAAFAMMALLPASAPAQRIFPYPYTQEDLPNGLRLITIPTGSPNIVSLYVVVQTGSRNEVEPGLTGFAHLFEHVMFRGTERFSPDQRAEIMKRAGATTNASTSDDLTVYYATFAKSDLAPVMEVEADRFQNLKYAKEAFQTETGAVLGEYNKNSSDPSEKLYEVLSDTAFDRHTYKHTTMGFLKDVQDMPNQYEYSLKFFDRYYRPEYTTIIVTGDVNAKEIRALVDKNWGAWKRGNYHPDIPVEPKQTAAREAHVDWPSSTLPQLMVAFKGPAYTDTEIDTAALDVIATMAFSNTSDLYQKLVVKEQKVDSFGAYSPANVDPGLFIVEARIKKAEDIEYVKKEILAEVEKLKADLLPKAKLEAVKSRERYGLALGMTDSDRVARTVSRFVALKRTPGTIDKFYSLYAKLTPEDLRNVAKRYFLESGRTIVTLTGPAAKGAK
jgi:zinc protease